VFLIDNDRSYVEPPADARLIVLRNETPRGFAANLNEMLRRARADRADTFFLNNDLVFTPHWLEPLVLNLPVMLSPLSNGQEPCQRNGWHCGPVLDLGDYLGHEDTLAEIVRRRQATVRGYQPVLNLPFFCVKIPWAVQEAVGELDERFGAGGGEDWDYCLRCHAAGFPVQYALDSYVLHFMGKSSWRGPETPAQSQARDEAYLQAFRAKWGPRLLEAVRDPRAAAAANGPAGQAWQRGHFRRVIELLASPERIGGQGT
jgi:GT2 family glycosyltransferase